MKKSFKEIKAMLQQEKWMWEGSEMRDYSWPQFLAEMAMIEIQMKWNERKCRKGHNYDRETGNPETGSYSIECANCGHVVSGYW